MSTVRGIASNLLSLVTGLQVLAIMLELGLRAVYFSADPRVLVYPPVANGINGLRDPDFDSEISPGEFRILALGPRRSSRENSIRGSRPSSTRTHCSSNKV